MIYVNFNIIIPKAERLSTSKKQTLFDLTVKIKSQE
jgi:hypothetical protein